MFENCCGKEKQEKRFEKPFILCSLSKTLAPDGFVIKGSFGNWYCVREQQRMALGLEYIILAAAFIALHSWRHSDELQS